LSLSYKTIRPLLFTGTNVASRWFSYIGLGIGVILLLCSLQMFVNIQQLLRETNVRKNGFDYVSISKIVTNQSMGQDNRFSAAELREIKALPYVADAAPLISNRFKVTATAGTVIPFATDIFIEALDVNFIDTVPPGFSWREGQEVVPVIFSSDFLEMYNVFAPSWDLPQLSKETASTINIYLRCVGKLGAKVFRASIVGFSDRVNSILVPTSFLEYANNLLEGNEAVKSSRIFVKTADVSNSNLAKYFDEKNYRVNKERTLFGRSKQALQGIISGLGIFGLLVIVLALMLFSFYLQLVIARSKDNLQLLLTLGYSPSWLSNKMARQFVPVYVFVVLTGLAFTQAMQWAFHHYVMYNRPELSSYVHWSVATTALFLILLSIVTNFRMVRRLLHKIP
jgi:ABC-type lipoprotein release transport system permease subunit